MSRYTVRVELHGADDKDYETLHDAMTAASFWRTVKQESTGKRFALPPGEYSYKGNVRRKRVLSKAEAAAKTTDRKAAILVTESRGRTWSGLKPA
jgi:hypothetical protein